MSVDDPSATFGQRITVTARGFQAGEQVDATLHSTPRSLGRHTADANGVVSFTFVPRADDGAGTHRVVLVGAESGTVETTITFAAAADLPATGAATRNLVLLASAALLAGGLALLAMQRRPAAD